MNIGNDSLDKKAIKEKTNIRSDDEIEFHMFDQHDLSSRNYTERIFLLDFFSQYFINFVFFLLTSPKKTSDIVSNPDVLSTRMKIIFFLGHPLQIKFYATQSH